MLRTGVLLSVSLLGVLAPSGPAVAQWTESHKLTASDAAAGDGFGRSVAISGNTAIVTAADDDDAGGASGSAYLFDVATGNQLFKLTASDAAEGDFFGLSAAISGNTAIVGATQPFRPGFNPGSAYLFDVATGNQLFKLTAGDAAAEDQFGESVAISGNRAIVGANLDDDAGSLSGSAYLFDVATGSQLFKLTASDAAAGDHFGESVAISGNIAIVGAPQHDDPPLGNSGSAYLFDVATGNQLFKLTASDAAAADSFGVSVAISGNRAIVGADLDDDAGSKSGSAYLFDVDTGNQLFKLTASDAGPFDNFGLSVAISDSTAIVGAPWHNDAGDFPGPGSAYLFDVATGSQLQELTASDLATWDWFGGSLGISGGAAIVGAQLNDDAGDNSGSAYLFVPEPTSVSLLAMAALGLLTCAWRHRRI